MRCRGADLGDAQPVQPEQQDGDHGVRPVGFGGGDQGGELVAGQAGYLFRRG